MKRSRCTLMDTGTAPPQLLVLPDAVLCEIARRLDARSLAMLEGSCSYWSRRQPISRLSLCEHIAKEVLQAHCGPQDEIERLRQRSWKERLHVEQDCGCGFDRAVCEEGGFRFAFSPDGKQMRAVHLAGMGPKLLLSDLSTQDKPCLRWRLRVRGNTAVEFGVIPADLEPSPTALHKCCGLPQQPQARAMGFCSQITAGSLLPLKAPVMRGTVLDILAQRGRIEVTCRYPPDAKEISWQNGTPVQRPYCGPSQLRFEQEFSPEHHVRLAITSWARAHFDILHDGFEFDPEWAAASLEAEAQEAALTMAGPAGLVEAHAVTAEQLLLQPVEHAHMEEAAAGLDAGVLHDEHLPGLLPMALPVPIQQHEQLSLAPQLPQPGFQPLGLPVLPLQATAGLPTHAAGPQQQQAGEVVAPVWGIAVGVPVPPSAGLPAAAAGPTSGPRVDGPPALRAGSAQLPECATHTCSAMHQQQLPQQEIQMRVAEPPSGLRRGRSGASLLVAEDSADLTLDGKH